MNNYIDKVKEIAASLGWDVSINGEEVDFLYYTTYDECCMSITATEDYSLFLRRIYSEYNAYDDTGSTDGKEFKAAMLELWENLKGINVNELYISNAHIYFKSTDSSAEAIYNQLQEICLQNGIELCVDGEAILRDSDGNDIDSYAD